MRQALASVVSVVAVLVMLVAVACSDSPTAPNQEVAAPQASVSGATVGSEGHGAGTVPPHSNGAVVVQGELGCGVLDGSGNFYPEDFPNTVLPCNVEVATYGRNANASLTVRASGVPNDTGRTVHWGPYNPGPALAAWYDADYPDDVPPYPCILAGPSRDFVNDILYTVNWHAAVTPSGEATFQCNYSKKWEWEGVQ